MIDIDHFKQLNDAHGHSTGDAVLRWLGAWLRDTFRSTDVVSRYGGEEFVVAFVDTGETDALCVRLEALRAGIEHSRLRTQDTDNELNVTVSIGIAHLPQDGATVNEVLTRADERLYGAKASGRNRIVAQTAG
jgi:two-component system cell cycle response regulator